VIYSVFSGHHANPEPLHIAMYYKGLTQPCTSVAFWIKSNARSPPAQQDVYLVGHTTSLSVYQAGVLKTGEGFESKRHREDNSEQKSEGLFSAMWIFIEGNLKSQGNERYPNLVGRVTLVVIW
jgi:hypothetical protein